MEESLWGRRDTDDVIDDDIDDDGLKIDELIDEELYLPLKLLSFCKNET